MSISMYFGLPRSGKTTFATAIAVKEAKRIKMGVSKYKAVYTNYPVIHDNVYQIDPVKDLGVYEITDSLILIDEATLCVDSRDYKNFDKRLRSYFFLHGHWRCDIIMFAQQWDGVDKGIRVCTDRVYYVHKGKIRRGISYAMPIPYGIIIPDPKKSDSEKLGEIVQGYCKPNIFVRMFQPRIKRKKYYKYFNSWDRPKLDEFDKKQWKSLSNFDIEN